MSETKYASINLLPRKEFEITLIDGTIIKGQFGTWSLQRFCDKRDKLSLGQLQLLKPDDYTIGDMVDMILCAVEYKARKENAPFSFTDVHCCSWIDELGGFSAQPVTDLFNHQSSDVEIKGADGEKKTET